MPPGLWHRIKAEIAIWRVGILPGCAVIGLVILARTLGLIQSLEWLAFDYLLRVRPPESIDERIVIVDINKDDTRLDLMADDNLATLLLKLQTYQPRVIGLDIDQSLPIKSSNSKVTEILQASHNIIASEKILTEIIPPPTNLPAEKIGFSDQIIDIDGKLRRILLRTPTSDGYKLSFYLRLASAYLAHDQIFLENGISDRAAIRFGKIELPRILPDSEGYIGTSADGLQLLLNFRSGRARFRTVAANDVKSGKVNPEWIRDRIVIIGITTPSHEDFITTAAIPPTQTASEGVSRVEISAHAVSQIISYVLDARPLLNTWDDLWIFTWGVGGIAIARLTKSALNNLIVVILVSLALILISYFCLICGWWLPLIPAILVLIINGMELTALYQYEQALSSGVKIRQAIIESTFETIHNGPLQSLAKVLQLIRGEDKSTQELLPEIEKELENLNHELRGIYEYLQQESLEEDTRLYLGNNLVLNLQEPLHDLLYQVYSYTLERNFPCFKHIRVKIRSFEPLNEGYLTIEQKRGICRFLEEALCNVGKHAVGATRLQVTYALSDGCYTLSIIDDGLGVNCAKQGRGTQQCINLAQQLHGKFQRSSLSPHGTICQLSWRMGSKRV
ncbi:MAG: CHASE2 domain-containing protein [Trichormus sp.]